MKRWGIAVLLTALVQLLAGCFVVGARTPGELMQTPSLEMDKQSIKETVNENLLPNEVLYRPSNPESLSAINFIDLDGDKTDESVVFYKNSENYRLGAYVFRRVKGVWELASKIESSGVDISYSGFDDLTGDGRKEIIMAWSADKLDVFLNKYMTVYKYGEIAEEVYNDSYTEMVTADFDENGSREMLLLNLNRNAENPSSTGELVAFMEGEFKVVDSIDLDPYINGYYNVAVGSASAEKTGIFLDMGIGAHSAATYLLVIENGNIINVFNSKGFSFYSETVKPYSIESQDINGDGIIEIATFEEPYGNDQPMSSTPWIANWYQWDGGDSLNLVMQNFVSSTENFRMDFPKAWRNKVTLRHPDEKAGILEIGYVDRQEENIYPLYTIYKLRDESFQEVAETFENGYLTVDGMNGTVVVIEKNYEVQSTPYRVRQDYLGTVLDDDELIGMIKTWR